MIVIRRIEGVDWSRVGDVREVCRVDGFMMVQW